MVDQCQLTVERYMPHLVKLLLESDEEDETYDRCLEFAHVRLESYVKPVSTSSAVWHNLAHFVDRYHCEQLQTLAETIQMLAKVIIADLTITETLKWAVLEFLLSVNFKAFRSARIHLVAYMTRCQEILDDLAVARLCSRQETRREFNLASFRQSLDQDTDLFSCRNSSLAGSLELLAEPATPPLSAQSTHRDCFLDTLSQSLQPQEQPGPIKAFSVSLPRPTSCRFAQAYGDFLRRKLQNVPLSLHLYGGEGFLIREMLALFFLPGDYHHFELVNHLIQLRPNALDDPAARQQVMQHFVKPLQYMQMLRLYIECCDDNGDNRLETLIALTAALRRLVKPVVESLTQYERTIAADSCMCTLRAFRHATKSSFERLELLWSLAAASYISYPKQFSHAPHSRSQHILCSLLELSTRSPHDSAGRRAYAAALLLHVLQVQCRFLDSWWQMGEFNDWHDEFPVRRVENEDRTAYVMRAVDKRETFMQTCQIYKIFKRHIKSAGPALAALYDSKRLGDFVREHKHMLNKSLHHSVVKAVHVQLKDYQIKSGKRNSEAALDIFWQLKSSEDEQLRCLYYVYYKETVMDYRQPGYCNIDELLRRCQNCAVYTPFDELICQTLERYLEQRARLLNNYVVHLAREQLQLAQTLQQLCSAYLLFNFERFAAEYVLAWTRLQQGHHLEAAQKLQALANSQHPNLGQVFSVELPSADLDQLALRYSCDIALACIISEPQLKCYNAAFRVRLQLHVTAHTLQQLRELEADASVTEPLLQLQSAVLSALHRHLQTKLLLAAAAQCEAKLQRCDRLAQLQELHHDFVQVLANSMRQSIYRSPHEMHDLLTIARICECLWQRVEFLLAHNVSAGGQTEFDIRYDDENRHFLATVNAACQAMLCLHPLN